MISKYETVEDNDCKKREINNKIFKISNEKINVSKHKYVTDINASTQNPYTLKVVDDQEKN